MQTKSIQPRILLAYNSNGHADRQMFRGFHMIAGEQNWLVLHVQSSDGISATVGKWDPHVVVVGSGPFANWPAETWAGRPLIGMNVNSPGRQIASVRPDDSAIGAAAANHLLAKGFKIFSTFMIGGQYPWAIERTDGFSKTIQAHAGKIVSTHVFSESQADLLSKQGMGQWARSLPKGTAVLAPCDDWAATLILSCRIAGVDVPDELAVMGVDDDDLVCEMCQPHLSSVRIPWQEIGRATAHLVEGVLRTGHCPTNGTLLAPAGIIERRSTELTAVDHPVVAQALRYLRSRAYEPMQVGDVVNHVVTNRRWLERAFRRYLGRTILQEIQRAHMDRARHLLATTALPMPSVARGSGFGHSTARFSHSFHKEVGMTPTEYRRKFSLHT